MQKRKLYPLILLCTILFTASGYAEDLSPFSVIKESIPTSWKQTFESINGPVTIDVDVLLPERDTLPVVELERYAYPTDELAAVFPQAQIDVDPARCMIQAGSFADCVYPEQPSSCGWVSWPAESEYAENFGLSRTELEQFTENLLHQLQIPASTDYKIKGVIAHSRTWLVDKNDNPIKPLNEHGYFDVYLQTSVHGLSVFDSFCFDQDNDRLHGPCVEMPQMHYFDDQNYSLCLSGYCVSRIRQEDSPILPFLVIQNEIEQLIVSGHLRAIYRLELCYVPMWSDDGKGIITVPAWVLWGEYHEKPSAASNQIPPDYYQAVIGGHAVVIPAQTGSMLNYMEYDQNRWLASTYLLEEGT